MTLPEFNLGRTKFSTTARNNTIFNFKNLLDKQMTQSTIVGLVTFFLGLILGHRLSLGRDKRKEFNDASAPIREWILHEIDLTGIACCNNPELDIIKLDTFIHCIPWWERSSFKRAYAKQKSERNKIYQDHDAIIKSLHVCLSFTNRK